MILMVMLMGVLFIIMFILLYKYFKVSNTRLDK